MAMWTKLSSRRPIYEQKINFWNMLEGIGSNYRNWQLRVHVVFRVHGNKLYVANAGDSRAVVARWADGEEQPQVHQLSTDHNVNDQARRDEVQAEHPDDPDLFRVVNGSYRVRGRIQVTRAIGEVYLKSDEFNHEPLPARYRQQRPIIRPILKAEPTIENYDLEPNDRFVIFGSDGLWEAVTNEEAVSIVKASPRPGAARALLKEALDKASKRNNQELIDDISVVILFLDQLPAQNKRIKETTCIESRDSKEGRGRHAKGASKKYFYNSVAAMVRSIVGKSAREALMLLDDQSFGQEAGTDYDEANEKEEMSRAWDLFIDSSVIST